MANASAIPQIHGPLTGAACGCGALRVVPTVLCESMTPTLLRLGVLCLALAGPLPRAPGEPPSPRGAPVPRVVEEARALLRAHRLGEAVERLRAEGPLNLADPERSWMLAQLAPLLEGLGPVRGEVLALPRSNLRLALLAMLSEGAASARAELQLWARRSSDPWVQLAYAGLCLRLGEHPEAVGAALRARARASDFVRLEALQLEARGLVELGRLEEAVARAREAQPLAADDGRPWALAGEVLRRMGRVEEAREALLEALARAPRSEPFARRLADLLREEERAVTQGVWSRVAALASPDNPEALVLLAHAAEARGEHAEALGLLEGALAAGANPVPVERRARHLLARMGRYRELERALEAALPEDARRSAGNLLGGRWGALEAAALAAPDAGAPASARLALAEALVGVGALEDARHVLEALPHGDGVGLRTRLLGHLAFEDALRREIEAGYRAGCRKQVSLSIDALLTRIAALARRHLTPQESAALAAPQTGLRRVALLGAWLDHRARSQAPLVKHFRSYGRYLVLGQRADQPCEAILLSLGVLLEAAPLVTRGQRHRHDFALGYDRVIRSFLDAQGGGLAGACLPDGLWLDADAALDAEHDGRALLRRDPALLEGARRQPLPTLDGPDGPFGLGDTGGLLPRLLARYVERTPGGRWGSLGTLHAHENGHVIDIRRHLPLWRGLPSTIALLLREGLSSARMEATLERRAQLASVIDAPDPDLALAEMVEMLPAEEHEPEAHAAGYRDGLALLVRHIWSRPDLYPEIDRSRRVLPQLDRLSNEQLRRAARAVVD